MPIPGGELTSSQIWTTPVEEYSEDQAAFDAAMAEVEDEDDLPELS